MKKPLLKMENIDKSFAEVNVLNNINFELRPGEVHILAGENGAGKSTLIKILCGVYSEYGGKIILEGAQVTFNSTHDSARHGISVIHQEMSLINAMSVVDNLHLGREIVKKAGWLDNKSQLEDAEKLLGRLGLDVNLNKNIEDYPMSVRQMIEIAKALAINAKVIIFDEPTSALNSPDVVKLFQIIDDLKKRGCGIIYITHKMKEIYKIGDRITVLRDGKYIGTAKKEDLPQAKLVNWMVGRTLNQQFPERISNIGKVNFSVKNCNIKDPSGGLLDVVRNVSFEVKKGEILGIGGLQGAGNTELFSGLFGVYGSYASGEMTIDDETFEIGTPAQSINRGMALLTNDRKDTGLILGLGITENITIASLESFSKNGFVLKNNEKKVAENYVSKLNIKTRTVAQNVDTLSGGNQQKVVLAKWMHTKPKVLLLDEPTRGVDVGAKHEIYELMNQWTNAGMSILLITSEMPELLAMSDRIIVMHLGEITAEFTYEEATQEKILNAAMGG